MRFSVPRSDTRRLKFRALARGAFCVVWCFAPGCGAVLAAPWVSLEVAAEQGVATGGLHAWARFLSEIGIDQVRIRGIRDADKPRVEIHGDGDDVRYALVGLLTRRDVLVLPGNKKFSLGDREKLRDYLESIEDQSGVGPPRERFDLTATELEALRAALTPPLGEATRGLACGAAFDLISRRLGMEIVLDAGDRAILDRAGPLEVELQPFSLGMALACAVRPAERAVAVERPKKRGALPTLHLVPVDSELETWPVGWRPKQVSKAIVPQIYRVTTIEIKGYTLAQTLTALEPHLKVPLILDQRQLATLGIEPDKKKVNVPRQKNSVKEGLDQALSQTRLGAELRVDEGGRPFFWITQFGKASHRAE